eukprot:GHVT01070504.1.p1 GENE.GHVT01070504.1~~GHVT01070504.1.p1  ORF type:complete len:267 (+),score=18.30 GHVT01070504.1:1755-2555(+)
MCVVPTRVNFQHIFSKLCLPRNSDRSIVFALIMFFVLIVQRSRNRRFAAMTKLSNNGEFFSETAMRHREPALFHEMLGRYHCDDPEVRAARDTNHSEGRSSVSKFLLHTVDRAYERENVMATQAKWRQEERRLSTEENPILSSEEHFDVSSGNRTHWEGPTSSDLQELLHPIGSVCFSATSGAEVDKRKASKDLMEDVIPLDKEAYCRHQEEFLSLMKLRFLNGQERGVDYETIDNDPELDRGTLLDCDAEAAYFDAETPSLAPTY